MKRNATLLCYVCDQKNEPVFQANVKLKKIGNDSIVLKNQQTSISGNCAFDNVSKGMYTVSCSHEEYKTEDRSQIDIDIHESQQEITLFLNRKGFQIAGHVLTAKDHTPVQDFYSWIV